jgi:8-oxo-dGTP pyrophosphatase MutT (NUDIX family)
MGNDVETLARGVCVKGGKILLCQTKGHANTYLPGGHVEFMESVPVALCRELEEELGVEARAGRYLGTAEHWFERGGKNHCEINLLFEMIIDEMDPDEIPGSQEEHLEFYWVELSEMSDYKMEPKVLIDKIPGWLESSDGKWASSYQ